MAGPPEMQRWKAMMETFLDPRYGVAAAGAGFREGMMLEKMQELLLSLSAMMQKLDRVLPPVDVAPGATASPHLHDGGAPLLLAAVLVAAFSLAGLLYFFFFYFFRAGGGGEGGGGVLWGSAAKALKAPRGEGLPSMSEHECMFVSVGTLLLVITLLGGFYYFYCYQAGCFGTGGGGGVDVRPHVVGPLAASAGRKLRMLSG